MYFARGVAEEANCLRVGRCHRGCVRVLVSCVVRKTRGGWRADGAVQLSFGISGGVLSCDHRAWRLH